MKVSSIFVAFLENMSFTNLTLNCVFLCPNTLSLWFWGCEQQGFFWTRKNVFRGLTRAWKPPNWDRTHCKFWEAASLAALQKCKVVKCILFIRGNKGSLRFQSNFVCRHRANIFGSNWLTHTFPKFYTSKQRQNNSGQVDKCRNVVTGCGVWTPFLPTFVIHYYSENFN